MIEVGVSYLNAALLSWLDISWSQEPKELKYPYKECV